MKGIGVLEWIAIGGVSLLAWPLIQFFDVNDLSSLPALILLFSLPHFALSYFLFYSQKGLAREHKFAAYFAPAALAIALIVLCQVPARLNFFVQIAYLLFFHHIAKQAYGVSLYYSGRATSHSKLWKYSILVMTLAWAMTAWLDQQAKAGTFMAFKSYVHTLELGPFYAKIARVIALAATGVSVFAWIKTGRRSLPSVILMSWTPLCALIVWCVPALGLTPLGLVPVLHGFQYLPFAWKKLSREGWRFAFASAVLMASLPIGYALFQTSSALILKRPSARAEVWVAMIYIFLNVHHYVLDRFMWRRKAFYDRHPQQLASSGVETQKAA